MTMYYIGKNGQQTGPFPEAEVHRRIQSGDVTPSDLCWREGMADWQPVASVFTVSAIPPPLPPAVVSNTGANTPPFLYIPTSRLIVMSIVSLSLYEAYWFYKNWCYVKERDNLNIKPFWRSVFGFFYCHSLFRRIHRDAQARAVQAPSFPPGLLATGWIVLMILANAVSHAPGVAAAVIAAFIPSFLCLVPVQEYVNAVCQRQRLSEAYYYRWSSGHIVCLVFGIVVWTMILLTAVTQG